MTYVYRISLAVAVGVPCLLAHAPDEKRIALALVHGELAATLLNVFLSQELCCIW